MSPKRFLLPVAISLSMLAAAGHAQTVESVLTALQKRKQAILIRAVVGDEVLEDVDAALDGRPPNYSAIEFDESEFIEWPEGIARFPEAGPNGINDLTKVLAALNHASLVFDEIKLQFLPFDPEAKRFVNEVCISESDAGGSKLEVPCIQLPSVGVFTEENWRTKLKLLASNVAQLRALAWPLASVTGRNVLDASLNGIYQSLPNGDIPTPTFTDPVTEEEESMSSSHPDWKNHALLPVGWHTQTLNFPYLWYPGKVDNDNVVEGNVVYGFGDHGLESSRLGGGSDSVYTSTALSMPHPHNTGFGNLPPRSGSSEVYGFQPAMTWTLEAGFFKGVLASNQVEGTYPALDGRYYTETKLDLRSESRLHPDHVTLPNGVEELTGSLILLKNAVNFSKGDLAEGIALLAADHRKVPLGFGVKTKEAQESLAFGMAIPLAPDETYDIWILNENQPSLGHFEPVSYRKFTTVKDQIFLDYDVPKPQNLTWITVPDELFALCGVSKVNIPGADFQFPIFGTGTSAFPQFQKDIVPRTYDSEAYMPDGIGVPGLALQDTGYLSQRFHYRIDRFLVAVLNFEAPSAPLVPESVRNESLASYSLGGVETGWGIDPVKIHLGRGRQDKNQVGWLGSRTDGFGSPTFHGSPSEFELLYEERPENFEDAYQSKKFDGDVPDEPAVYQAAGWRSRFDYIANWHSPRLRQIRGGDVLVDVSYQSSYHKTLRFYWVQGLGPKVDGYYPVNPASAFKEVVLCNPTGPSAGGESLATDPGRLQVIEAGQRYYNVTINKEEGEGPQPFIAEDITLTVDEDDDSENGEHQKIVVHVPWGDVNNSFCVNDAITVTDVTQGITTQSTLTYESGFSPRETDTPVLASASVEADNETRTTTLTWDKPEEPERRSDFELTKVAYSGPVSWELNGAFVDYSATGRISKETRFIGGKLHELSHTWAQNQRTTTSKLGGLAYRSEEVTYSLGFTKAEQKIDQVLAVTHNWQSATSTTAGVPWSYASADYPGGYHEKVTLSTNANGASTAVETGWGVSMSSGTLATKVVNRFGRLVSETSSVGGVLVSSATVAPADQTDWGAPKKITFLRGDTVNFTYQQAGLHWGQVQTSTDAYGVTTTVTNRDWLGRLVKWTDSHGESYEPDYTNPLAQHLKLSKNTAQEKEFKQTFSAFGDPRTELSKFGIESSYNYTPGAAGNAGSVSMTVDGRTKTGTAKADGMIDKINGGLGSRGESFDFGVDGGKLYTEVTPLTKTDTARTGKIRTYYDGHGRVKQIDRPSHTGAGTITESWSYQDVARSVIHYPPPGPQSQWTRTNLSPDGGTVTVALWSGSSFHESYRTMRFAAGGKIIEVVELNDDSETGSALWKEVSRVEVDPGAGSVARTPWNLAASGSKLVASAPGATGIATLNEGADGGGRLLKQVSDETGLTKNIVDHTSGARVDLSVTNVKGQFVVAGGTIGGAAGQPVGFGLDEKRRLGSLIGPRSNQTFTYATDPQTGVSTVTVADNVQGTGNTFGEDRVGDPTQKSGSGDVDWTVGVADQGGGSTITLNGSRTMQANVYGELLSRSGGPIAETYTRAPDGTLLGHTQGTLTRNRIYDGPYKWTDNFAAGGGTLLSQEREFYRVGLAKRVTQTVVGQAEKDEEREFKYLRGQLAEELHTEGPLKGWKVEYIPDTKGRLGMIRVGKTGEVAREFSFGYDAASRLSSSTVGWSEVPPMAASYGRDNFGNVQTFSRGGMTTTLTHDPANNRLTSVENVRGSTNYAYTYNAYDSRHRIGGRFASHGASWGSLSYDNADRLGSVSLPRSQFKTYAYDSRNNRTGQFAVAGLTINTADQLTGKTLTGRGFGVSGKVRPGAAVEVFHSLTPGTAFSPWLSPLTGDFGYATSVPPTTNNGAAVLVEAKVRGTYTQAGQPTAIAEGSMFLRVPPMAETINYDGAGRQIEDAYWTYTWDPAGRLTKKTAKLPAHPNASAETVDCVYDADNRRIQKTHTITFNTGAQLRERSTVLWAGDFELCETLERTGKPTVRKWFQRGVDVSGTLSGAAGIGGLVAIHEESPVGTWKRTLLPVNDGIGNVTIVLNAANGARVATYDYGPFGEPLGETGEADACPFRWQTRWYDRESEQYHFKERDYEPKTGRWLSMDPLREGGGLNYYAYCGNDPVNRYDPLGLAELDPSAPSDAWIQSRIESIPFQIERLRQAALARNATDCISWRPERFVTAGADGISLEGEKTFLEGVLRARAAIGPNGYGTFGVDNVLHREFGSLDEGVLRFFTPADGYVTTANMRENFAHMQTAASWALNATTLMIPLPFPRGGGAIATSSRVAVNTDRLGPIIEMAPGANGVIVPSFEARAHALSGRVPMRQMVLHQDQIIMNAYQSFYNNAWLRTVRDFSAGRIPVPSTLHWKTVLGRRTDAIARERLRNFLSREGIAEGHGTDVLVNRRLLDLGSSAYRVPDLRLMQTRKILDGTIGNKTLSSPQAIDFFNFSGGDEIIFVRPTVGPIP